MKGTLKKDINTEICRITLMLFIIMHHLILNGVGLRKIESNLFDKTDIAYAALNAYLIVAVNIFFLISGYYTIKLKIKKIINISLIVYFYFIIINLIFLILGLEVFNLNIIKKMFFPISGYWFIFVYIILSLFSPLINIMLQNCSKYILKRYILISSLIFLFYDFTMQNSVLGINAGYSLTFSIYLYILGYYLRNYYNINISKNMLLLIYLISSGINGLLAVIFIYLNNGEIAWELYSYNNPLVLIGSVSLFLFFKSLVVKNEKKNKIILEMSSIVLAAYIIHSTSILSNHIYLLFSKYINILTGINKTIVLLLYTVLIFISCYLIEIIRKSLFEKIFDSITEYIYIYYKKIINIFNFL